MAQAMTERCYRTEGFLQGPGVCRGRFRAAAAMRHLSARRGLEPLGSEAGSQLRRGGDGFGACRICGLK